MVSCVEVTGIPIWAGDLSSAVTTVLHVIKEKPRGHRPLVVTATSAHGLVVAQRNPVFREILCSSFMNLPDGVPPMWVARVKGACRIDRCFGPDFFRLMLEAGVPYGITHFFLGGRPGVADQLKNVVREKYGGPEVVGTYCPPFRPMTDEELYEVGRDIDKHSTDIVWIGISTPKQEYLAYRLTRFCNARFIITVGAAFDYHTGHGKRAPCWMQRSGLEWAYRLIQSPRRLFGRYAEVVPMFMLYAVKDIAACKAKGLNPSGRSFQ